MPFDLVAKGAMGLDPPDDIIADEPCGNDGCEGKLKFRPDEQIWECESCGCRSPLDLVEHMEYAERLGPFANLP